MNIQQIESIYENFTQRFSIDRLRNLDLNEYTNLERENSFCYWLESKTIELGSILGGSSFKFGIYERKNEKKPLSAKVCSDDQYTWYAKYGDDRNEAFNIIKSKIIEIAEYAASGEFEQINNISIGEAYKWKIAFLYSNKSLIGVYKKECLQKAAEHYGEKNSKRMLTSELHEFLLSKKDPQQNIFEFSNHIWQIGSKNTDEIRYWTFKHKPGMGGSELGSMEFVEKAIRLNAAIMQYEYGLQEQGMVTQNWNKIQEINDGDYIFLRGDSNVYAVGKVISHRCEGDVILNMKRIIKEKKHTEYCSDEYNGTITFEDNSIFYEDLSDGENEWGQRIDVEKWMYYNPNGIYIKDTSNYIENQNEFGVLKQLKPDIAKNVIEQLKLKFMGKETNLLLNNKNIVLTGAPGTGKTYLAKQMALKIAFSKDKKELLSPEEIELENSQIKLVQFHPSYDYTDFVEGLRPVKRESDKEIGFERMDGVFKTFCKEAINNPSRNYVFIIDEINRGELSKIFGELFFSIDPFYRGQNGKVNTQYQNLIKEDDEFFNGFYVPDNVYIIGTMNDIDRSVESMDFAIRRRFTWCEITAEASAVNMGLSQDIKDRMSKLNNALSDESIGLSNAYHIGGAYYLNINDFDYLWNYKLESLLREYLRGDDMIDDKISILKNEYYK